MPSKVKSWSSFLLLNYSKLAYKELLSTAWTNFSDLWTMFYIYATGKHQSDSSLSTFLIRNRAGKELKSASYFLLEKALLSEDIIYLHLKVTDLTRIQNRDHALHWTPKTLTFFFFFLVHNVWVRKLQSFYLKTSQFHRFTLFSVKFIRSLEKTDGLWSARPLWH